MTSLRAVTTSNPYLSDAPANIRPNRSELAQDERSLSGGEALSELLLRAGVREMFGMGGFQLAPFYEGIRQRRMRHILVNDERTAAFAADAWARVTGRIGVCDATLGPGATNLVTGLVESLNAGIPVLAITGQATRVHSGKNLTQECRQSELLRPACKELLRVENIRRLPEMLRRALWVATAGRPGPVVLEIPEDVAHDSHCFSDEAWQIGPALGVSPQLRCVPPLHALQRALDAISHAARPIFLVGGGIHLSGAYAELQALASRLEVPVAYTASGKGCMADSDPWCIGLFGRYDRFANTLVRASDCIVAIGCKLGEVATKRFTLLASNATLIHVDTVPEEFGRTHAPTIALWGDARETLSAILMLTGSTTPAGQDRQAYQLKVAALRRDWEVRRTHAMRPGRDAMSTASVCAAIRLVMHEDTIIVADGGFAAHWAALFLDTPGGRRSFIADRGFASIGYGIPGCIGASLAAPEAQVIGLTGDGGTNMTLGDLETARRCGTGFILVVLNNAASGYVRAGQHALYGQGNYQSSDLLELDYAAIARQMGCEGFRTHDQASLEAALQRAVTLKGKVIVIDAAITRDPERMMPGTDDRTPITVQAGDRPI